MGQAPRLLVARAVNAISRQLRRAANVPVPPMVQLLSMAESFTVSGIIRALVELGVGDALRDNALTVEELATRIKADPDALMRLLRPAAHLGLVQRQRDRFRLTKVGRGLRSDAIPSLVPWVRYMNGPYPQGAFGALAESVRTGRPGWQVAHGQTFWDWLAENPEQGDMFASMQRTLTDAVGTDLVALVEWPANGRVCDVGSGVGTLLSYILRAGPTLTGIALDQQQVLDQAPPHLMAWGIANRTERVPHDFFEPIPVTADIFVMKDVLHDWDEDRCLAILAGISDAMRPGDRLVLFEILQDPIKAHTVVPFADLHMMTQTDGGRQRSINDFDRLFARASLQRSKVSEGIVYAAVEAVLIENRT